MPPTKCPNCGEETYQRFKDGGLLHKYNLRAECPDGTGLIVGIGPDGGPMATNNTEAGAALKALEAAEELLELFEGKPPKPSGTAKDRRKTKREKGDDEETSANNTPSEGDSNNDKDNSEKYDSQGSGEGDQQSSEAESEENSPPKPEPQDSDEDWALAAATAVNELWRERVARRGYAPTEDELKKIILDASQGKVTPPKVEAPFVWEPPKPITPAISKATFWKRTGVNRRS